MTTYKILIIGPAWVGDMVMAQQLFQLLHEQHGDLELHVSAPTWTMPILKRMPEIQRAMPFNVKHGQLALYYRYKLGRALRKEGYRQAIILPNSFKSALVPYFAGIPLRTGYRGEMRYHFVNDLRILDTSKYPRMLDRFNALAFPSAQELKIDKTKRPQLKIDERNLKNIISKFNLDLRRPPLIIAPGAEYGISKQWPAEYFAHITEEMVQQGWQVWCLGSKNDERIAKEIQQLVSCSITNLAGQTSLGDAIDLMSVAEYVVSNDSGLMHIAANLNKPLIVLYGSTSPDFTPPLSDRADILFMDKETVPCRPCFKRNCPLKHHDCMKMLMPERVLSILNKNKSYEDIAS